MKIVGVFHSTLLPEEEAKHFGVSTTTNEVSETKKFLEPGKLHGVEFPRWGNDAPVFSANPDIAKKHLNKKSLLGSGLRFSRALSLYAERRGAKLIHLEEEGAPAAVSAFLRTLLYEHEFPDDRTKEADPIIVEASKVRGFDLKSFVTALQVWRSVLMLKKAEEEKCGTLIMGATHARHLEQLGYDHEYHYSPLSKNVKNADLTGEINAYLKYEKAFKQAVKRIQETKQ